LLNGACFAVANEIKGKTREQIRTEFHIQSDNSKTEEEIVREKYPWVFN
jgi:hypothetical protein